MAPPLRLKYIGVKVCERFLFPVIGDNIIRKFYTKQRCHIGEHSKEEGQEIHRCLQPVRIPKLLICICMQKKQFG